MARILALDIGSKRIGLAITDEEQIISQPLPYTVSPEEILENLQSLINDYEIEEIVVGLPKSLSGEEGTQAQEVRSFIDIIKSKIKTPINYFDERLTTKQAKMLQRDNMGVPIDALAAQQLLEQYLRNKK